MCVGIADSMHTFILLFNTHNIISNNPRSQHYENILKILPPKKKKKKKKNENFQIKKI